MSGIPHLEEDADRTAILVVDDRPDKILVLRSVLEDLGQVIVSAGSGDEALRHVLERDFAVILLDVNMPVMNGFETATLIRNRPRSEHTPIIFVTAEASASVGSQQGRLVLRGFSPSIRLQQHGMDVPAGRPTDAATGHDAHTQGAMPPGVVGEPQWFMPPHRPSQQIGRAHV